VTQQVVKCVWSLPSSNPQMPTPSIDFVFEATGSNVNIDWTATITPLTVINAFWNELYTGASAVPAAYLSSEYARGATPVIEVYDITAHLDGSPAGSPIKIETDYLVATMLGTSDLHPALVGVLAYRRVYGSDPEVMGATRPRARDRGRLHIGPLRNVAMDDGTGKMHPQFATDLFYAAYGTANTQNPGAANQFDWRAWSRKNASVGRIAFAATQYGLGIDRRRVNETNSRVLPWAPIP
jgi:hypothetical protein